MSTPGLEWAGIGAGGERMGVTENLGSLSKIQQQFSALSKQMAQLTS